MSSVAATSTTFPRDFEENDSFNYVKELFPTFKKHSLRVVKTLQNANYGTVCLAEGVVPRMPASLLSGQKSDNSKVPCRFALKKMPKAAVLSGKRGMESAANELLANIATGTGDLPFTAKFYGVAQDSKNYYLMSEFCDRGELLAALQKMRRLDEVAVREVIYQVIVSVKELHHRGVAHRDISLENVLVAQDGTMRLIDLGQAIMLHKPGETDAEQKINQQACCALAGKYHYRAPEIGRGEDYSGKAADMFAIGVMAYALAAGAYPFNSGYVEELFPRTSKTDARATRITDRLQYMHASVYESITENFIDFLQRVMSPNMDARLTAHEALSHPWIVGCIPVQIDALDKKKPTQEADDA